MKGRAIILRTETRIDPFGDPASEAFFSGETVAQTQDRTFRELGFEVVRAATAEEAIAAASSSNGPCLILLDRIYISEKAARDFLQATKKIAPPIALALELNASVEYTLPLQDVLRDGGRVVHDVVRVDRTPLPPPEQDNVVWLRKIRDGAKIVEVPKREVVLDIPLPVIGEREMTLLRYPITSTIVASIEHWVHILWLNQLAFGVRWIELIRRKPLWALLRAASALSLDRDRVMLRMVHKGRGVKVHPTATLSAAIIGDGAKIGAHATVRNSIVGPGAIVEDHAVLHNSVIGASCLITENSFIVFCTAYPNSTIGNYKLQVSLIGRDAYVNAWAGFVDAKFMGFVNVQHKGALASTERAFLGSVVGHRAKVAAKVLIHAGRELPNDTVVVMRPDEVVSVIPKDLPAGRPLVRDRGTLVPLGEESK